MDNHLKPKFCMYCGAPLMKITIENHFHYECTSCNKIHWLNSRPCVEAIIIQANQILLIRRRMAPKEGKWGIPGGFLELGEHPVDGLHREIDEELGASIEILKFIGHYVDIYGEDLLIQTFNCSYLCQLTTSVLYAQDDISEFNWFPLDQLPELAFDHYNQVLQDYYNEILQFNW